MTRRTLHRLRRQNQKREEMMIITAGATIIAAGLLAINITQTPVQAKPAGQARQAVEVQAVAPVYALTDGERELIERVIAAESRGESFEGQLAVAQVIKDRSECWGMSITEVLNAPYQFAAPYGGEIPDGIKDAVHMTFDEGYCQFETRVTHFHASYVSPTWVTSKSFIGQIGAHLFYA